MRRHLEVHYRSYNCRRLTLQLAAVHSTFVNPAGTAGSRAEGVQCCCRTGALVNDVVPGSGESGSGQALPAGQHSMTKRTIASAGLPGKDECASKVLSRCILAYSAALVPPCPSKTCTQAKCLLLWYFTSPNFNGNRVPPRHAQHTRSHANLWPAHFALYPEAPCTKQCTRTPLCAGWPTADQGKTTMYGVTRARN